MPEKHLNIGTAVSVNPAATTVNNNYYGNAETSRMAADFEKLRYEIRKGITQNIFDELDYYLTELPGTKPAEDKLSDGHFSDYQIREAMRQKDLYARRAEKYKYYPAAQQIIYDIFCSIKNEFYASIYPMVETSQPLADILLALRTNIVKPLMEKLERNGASDEYLRFSEDHIYGMIYYLTGMCHLNWTVYSKEH